MLGRCLASRRSLHHQFKWMDSDRACIASSQENVRNSFANGVFETLYTAKRTIKISSYLCVGKQRHIHSFETRIGISEELSTKICFVIFLYSNVVYMYIFFLTSKKEAQWMDRSEEKLTEGDMDDILSMKTQEEIWNKEFWKNNIDDLPPNDPFEYYLMPWDDPYGEDAIDLNSDNRICRWVVNALKEAFGSDSDFAKDRNVMASLLLWGLSKKIPSIDYAFNLLYICICIMQCMYVYVCLSHILQATHWELLSIVLHSVVSLFQNLQSKHQGCTIEDIVFVLHQTTEGRPVLLSAIYHGGEDILKRVLDLVDALQKDVFRANHIGKAQMVQNAALIHRVLCLAAASLVLHWRPFIAAIPLLDISQGLPAQAGYRVQGRRPWLLNQGEAEGIGPRRVLLAAACQSHVGKDALQNAAVAIKVFGHHFQKLQFQSHCQLQRQ
ncbi:hypothetical protein RFI_34593 [Reticulomyxa filosa]|uniref:Uncharacterized protein n=1 Tax=Reticulomyxa filosa TaxID=46433 RepID=X6LQ06_RETFI|nr:hypothetical protein RFI_34593 [Reticulomyxa filosa]|eukprot:ETO02820.1 hypothetical protein RFI_34593 [Reticulomyxa filosa]